VIVLDASVWMSALFTAEIHHRQSQDWLAGATTGSEQLLVPALFLAEISEAVARRTGDPVAGPSETFRRTPQSM